MIDMFEEILQNVYKNKPMVHNITNYVTVNDCANIILACGGSPIMADDIDEVCEITGICKSLVINIGTLNSRTVRAMASAGRKANELSHPVVLDPVGAGASVLRTQTALNLLENVNFSVIRGNISEIKAIARKATSTKGVDADVADSVTDENLDEVIEFACKLSKTVNSVITITGAIDIVTDSKKTYVIKNGCATMSKITGSGCMLTCVIGSYCGANPENILDATAAAVVAMGLCGELAEKKMIERNEGTGSFRTYLIDNMSNLDINKLNGGMKLEIR